MFAVKTMEVSFNRLKLKLDMAYREIPVEEAQTRFDALTVAPDVAPLAPVGDPAPAPEVVPAPPVEVPVPPKATKSKRKVVTALVPK
jgi:hypothetical protein